MGVNLSIFFSFMDCTFAITSRNSLFHCHSWNIFLLDTEYWHDSFFFQHLKSVLSLPFGFQSFWCEDYNNLSCFPCIENASLSSRCFKIIFIAFSFQILICLDMDFWGPAICLLSFLNHVWYNIFNHCFLGYLLRITLLYVKWIASGICYMTQGTQPRPLWQPRGVGWSRRQEGGGRGGTYPPMAHFLLMYGRNWHNIVKQSSFN